MAQGEREREYVNRIEAQDWIGARLVPTLNEWILLECRRNGTIVSAPTDATNTFGVTMKARYPWLSSADMNMDALTTQKPLKEVSYTILLEVSVRGVTGHISFEMEGEHKSAEDVHNILDWDEAHIVKDLNDRVHGIKNK